MTRTRYGLVTPGNAAPNFSPATLHRAARPVRPRYAQKYSHPLPSIANQGAQPVGRGFESLRARQPSLNARARKRIRDDAQRIRRVILRTAVLKSVSTVEVVVVMAADRLRQAVPIG